MGELYSIIRSEEHLEHHGVLGMKWGIRRYQPYSVVPRGSGKSGKFIGNTASQVKRKIKKVSASIKRRNYAKKREKEFNERTKQLAKEMAKAEQKEKIKSSPTELYRHRSEYSAQELKEAVQRLATEKQLKDLSMKELGRGKETVDLILGYGKTALDVYNTGKNIKKTIDEISGNNSNQQSTQKTANKSQETISESNKLTDTSAKEMVETAKSKAESWIDSRKNSGDYVREAARQDAINNGYSGRQADAIADVQARIYNEKTSSMRSDAKQAQKDRAAQEKREAGEAKVDELLQKARAAVAKETGMDDEWIKKYMANHL